MIQVKIKTLAVIQYSNCLVQLVQLKNVDIDKYKYSGYGIRFDRPGFFSHHSGGTGRNVIIFGVDMSSSTKIDNRKKDILILRKDLHKDYNTDCLQKKYIKLVLLKIIKKFV